MDGHFVPALTMGPVVVEACRRATRLPLDVHLMVEHPETLLAPSRSRRRRPDRPRRGLSAPLSHSGIDPRPGDETGAALNPGTPVATPGRGRAAPRPHPGHDGEPRRLRATVSRGGPGETQTGARELRPGGPFRRLDRGRWRDHAETAARAAAAGAEAFVAAHAVFRHPAGIEAGVAIACAASCSRLWPALNQQGRPSAALRDVQAGKALKPGPTV